MKEVTNFHFWQIRYFQMAAMVLPRSLIDFFILIKSLKIPLFLLKIPFRQKMQLLIMKRINYKRKLKSSMNLLKNFRNQEMMKINWRKNRIQFFKILGILLVCFRVEMSSRIRKRKINLNFKLTKIILNIKIKIKSLTHKMI